MSEQLELSFGTSNNQTSDNIAWYPSVSVMPFGQQFRSNPEAEEWRKHYDTAVIERNNLAKENKALLETIKILSRGC